MVLEVRLSSKGQVVLPKVARETLGLKKGDLLKVEVDEQKKTIIMQPSVEAPREIFVKAGNKLTNALLKESDEIDERKARRLLRAIGVTPD
jgi:AbrB family looped-hinge helix DNA binding protein